MYIRTLNMCNQREFHRKQPFLRGDPFFLAAFAKCLQLMRYSSISE